jgi:hypothetical protein
MARRQRGRPIASQAVPIVPTLAAAAAAEPPRPDLHEYEYVFGDLKRVAILAAALFALLIGLSFFIR